MVRLRDVNGLYWDSIVTPMNFLVRLEQLSFGFDASNILIENLSYDILPQTIVLMRGPNGIGKSTFLKALVSQQNLFIEGKITFDPSIDDQSRAYLTQNFDNSIHLPLSLGDIIRAGSLGRPLSQLNSFGLLSTDDCKKSWQNASGGEKQKTIFTRVLNTQPRILLLDEPTNHLDRHSIAQLWDILDSYIGDKTVNRSAIVVTHHQELPDFRFVTRQILDLEQFIPKKKVNGI